jgi:hypothetical protein
MSETLRLDAQWVNIETGWLVWNFHRPTRVLGFEFRVHPDEEQHRAATLADFLERTQLVELYVGNQQQLVVTPVPLGLLFGDVHLFLPLVHPGVLLRVRLFQGPRGFQLRPTGEQIP